MNNRRNLTAYLGLLAAFLLVVAWQRYEHRRVTTVERQALLNRALDITNAIGLITRSGAPGVIRHEEMQVALDELVDDTELISVALLNREGETVVSAGEPFKNPPDQQLQQAPRWDQDRVTIVNPVDFGTWQDASGTTQPIIILPPQPDRNDWNRDRDRDDRDRGDRDRNERDRNSRDRDDRNERDWNRGPDRRDEGPGGGPGGPEPFITVEADSEDDTTTPSQYRISANEGPERRTQYDIEFTSNSMLIRSDDSEAIERLQWIQRVLEQQRTGFNNRRPSSRSRSMVFRRPPWMSREDFQEMQSRLGLHGFVLVLSNEATRRAIAQDFWLRLIIVFMTSLAATGGAIAWTARGRSAKLQMRLLRAQEMNLHLRELNLAAAGLAHETRNPLNIVRGLAQMLASKQELTPDDRGNASTIATEVDRVTSRLNEFINYSRPVEPRLSPVRLQTLIDEVNRALTSDREDKHISFDIEGSDLTIRADEALLRQVIFNLVLNAIQAIDQNGHIIVRMQAVNAQEAKFEILDDGPGVPADLQDEIFRPYVTGHEQGTGLGLAVVRQIVLAHHWDIEYRQNQPKGAIFEIHGMQIIRPGGAS